jgi:glucose-6-phosphate 1-dehydrogenase
MVGQPAELVASRQPGADEMAAYERVLGDALAGDAALFARMTMSKSVADRRSGADDEQPGS